MNGYNPKVSIVIPAYNASNYLAEAIDSALAQTYKNIEIIVVNDGSKDDGATAAVAARYGNKIRYFEKENGGSSSALNTGIANMTGDWFSWLSHDDLYLPHKVQSQIDYMNDLALSECELKKHVFFGAYNIIDGNGKLLKKTKLQEAKAVSEAVSSFPGNEYLISEPTVFNFHGCSCLVHKSVFEAVGAFDEGLRFLNDYDIWFRIYAGGYKIHFLPEVLVCGRIHGKQVSKSNGYSYHNPEQDAFWKRSLDWLADNHPDNYELYFKFGRNAYSKARNEDGDRAFAIASALRPDKKLSLSLKKRIYKLRSALRSGAKKVYLKLKQR